MALTPETRQKIVAELERYPRRRSALLPALRHAQAEVGHLPPATLVEVANLVGADANALAMLVTFYDLLDSEPVGKNVLSVCDGLACRLVGSADLLTRLRELLRVDLEQVTSDGKFTVKRMECLAACQLAPCLIVNRENYAGYVTAANVAELLERLADPVSSAALAQVWAEGHLDVRTLSHTGGTLPHSETRPAGDTRAV